MTHPVLFSSRSQVARHEVSRVFREACGWGNAECVHLAGDASFRTYYRLRRATGETSVLMDAPPPDEDVRPFIDVGDYLRGLGLSAPSVLAKDIKQGFLLLQDFGDDLYSRVLAAEGDAFSLYTMAADVLSVVHQAPIPPFLPEYDEAFLLREVSYLPDWFCHHCTPSLSDEARTEYMALWTALLPVARAVPEVVVLRDYHAENLMHLQGENGLKACGLLDFQGAVRGPLTYDLMSLMEDARRDICTDLRDTIRDDYMQSFPNLDRGAFLRSWSVMAAQRHAKVIGLFIRLWKRDKKPMYLVHLPRVWRLMERACQDPVLQPLRRWLDCHIPEDVRRRIPA